VPDDLIPADELGEITRSRNETIRSLRAKEAQLAEALAKLEEVATDLKRKNHLLEAARRNLADADRLASLGIMSGRRGPRAQHASGRAQGLG
jgi:C4-dicarboxylate-specific signal transduction histidine kinase